MLLFVLRRGVSFFLTLGFTSLVVFVVLEWLPGNAAQVILGETATPESIQALEQKLGLDRPIGGRYLSWVGALLQGHTGLSMAYDVPTFELIVERLQVTLPLAGKAVSAHVAGVWGIDPDELPVPGLSAFEMLDRLGTADGVRALLVLASNLVVNKPRITIGQDATMMDIMTRINPVWAAGVIYKQMKSLLG